MIQGPACSYNDCHNIGVETYQCDTCQKFFCDEHRKVHVADHAVEKG
jgi:hypothetical protein